MNICAVSMDFMGLCNRLRALVSCMRLAKRFGIPCWQYWPVNDIVPCQFSDLFDLQIRQVEQIQGNILYISWHLFVGEDELPRGWARNYPADDVNGHAIDFEYERIPQPLRDVFLEQILRLSPRPELVHRAGEIAKGPYVSVHIRDGSDWEKFGRTTPLDHFLETMEVRPDDTRFFVSAHQPATIEVVERRFPGRVMHQPGKDYQGRTVKRMQDSLVDLLCLSRGTSLIGTYGSTFTDMAWWLGRCVQPVKIVEADRSQYRYE